MHKCQQRAIMPNGQPAPSVLTEAEAIKFLRIGSFSNPSTTLRYYRSRGKLHGAKIGRGLFYTSVELLRFLEKQTEGVSNEG